jgi:hypothetical protein
LAVAPDEAIAVFAEPDKAGLAGLVLVEGTKVENGVFGEVILGEVECLGVGLVERGFRGMDSCGEKKERKAAFHG